MHVFSFYFADTVTIIAAVVGVTCFIIIAITTVVLYRSYLARKYNPHLTPNAGYEVRWTEVAHDLL